tara:strand:+ start:269 stop:427 length:159 start_codon:yes stop_codon:yes gene_type:complete
LYQDGTFFDLKYDTKLAALDPMTRKDFMQGASVLLWQAAARPRGGIRRRGIE